jgi:hypothetical protein
MKTYNLENRIAELREKIEKYTAIMQVCDAELEKLVKRMGFER